MVRHLAWEVQVLGSIPRHRTFFNFTFMTKILADRWDLNGETTELHFYDEVHNISMTISSTLSQLNKGVDAQTGHP